MVLQRWQTVHLFFAAVMMIVFIFLPVFSFPVAGGGVFTMSASCGQIGNCILLILDVLVVLLLLVTIFKFRDLKLQQQLCSISMLIMVSLMAYIGYLAYWQQSASFTLWVALPVLALLLTWWARRCIKSDRKLLSDSARIR